MAFFNPNSGTTGPGPITASVSDDVGERSFPVGPADHVAAGVTPWPKIASSERRWCLEDAEWQSAVRKYDRLGDPGIVGATLDIPASTSHLLELCVRRRSQCGYGGEVIHDDPLLTAVLGMWRGETYDQKHLFARLMRTLDAVGECYMVMWNADRPGRIYWQLAQTTNCRDNKDGTTTIRTRPDARPGEQGHRTAPDHWVYRAMVSDLEWEGEAWSPVRRGLPHIEQYRSVMRNIGRNLDSQLAMNGVLWAQAAAVKPEWPEHMKAWSHRAITSDDGIEAVMPFVLVTAGDKPEFIDVGRGDHKDQIEVAELFLKSFAQSQDVPTNMILEGPAQGKFLNSFLESDYMADVVMSPRWQRACSLITESHLRPLLHALPSEMTAHLKIDELEVWADDTRVRSRPDNSDKLIRLYELGVITREALAECASVDADQVLELPDGVTPFEAWLASRAPATLSNRERGNPGVQGLIDDDFDADRVMPGIINNEPDIPALAPGSFEPPTPTFAAEVIEATAEIVNEIDKQQLPDYWHDLIPT